MVNPATNAPFQKGDKVYCHVNNFTEYGEVVDSWHLQGSWLIMVDHGEIESAYAPHELSLVSEDGCTVVHVDFKTKTRL